MNWNRSPLVDLGIRLLTRVQVGEMKHLLPVNQGGVEFQSLNWVTQLRVPRCR